MTVEEVIEALQRQPQPKAPVMLVVRVSRGIKTSGAITDVRWTGATVVIEGE